MKTITKLQIIYRNNKPYGIRDSTGFLFFFADISKYTGQEERYRQEVEEQYALVDKLLEFLINDSKQGAICGHDVPSYREMDKCKETTKEWRVK